MDVLPRSLLVLPLNEALLLKRIKHISQNVQQTSALCQWTAVPGLICRQISFTVEGEVQGKHFTIPHIHALTHNLLQVSISDRTPRGRPETLVSQAS